MTLNELRTYRVQIQAIAARSGVTNIRVFGSVARGEAQTKSDIDFLVTPLPKCGWGFFGFATEIEDLLSVKVGVVSDRAINRHIKDAILKEALPL